MDTTTLFFPIDGMISDNMSDKHITCGNNVLKDINELYNKKDNIDIFIFQDLIQKYGTNPINIFILGSDDISKIEVKDENMDYIKNLIKRKYPQYYDIIKDIKNKDTFDFVLNSIKDIEKNEKYLKSIRISESSSTGNEFITQKEIDKITNNVEQRDISEINLKTAIIQSLIEAKIDENINIKLHSLQGFIDELVIDESLIKKYNVNGDNLFINEFVEKVCSELNIKLGTDDKTVPITDIGDNEQNCIKYFETKQINAKIMLTRGDGSCLIHAILTCISLNYRKLKYNYREIVGRAFRYFLNIRKRNEYIMTTEWLNEFDLFFLSDFFHFNYYVYQIDNYNNLNYNYIELNYESPNICIFATGRHFSSIKCNESYTLTKDKLKELNLTPFFSNKK
jgi:disulfide oxidoreductase YuzD